MSQKIKHPLLFMLCVACSAFMAGVDLMIMGVAIDPMRKAFHASVNNAQWLFTAFAIGCAACYVGVGRISDRVGKRNTFEVGMLLFGLSSIGVGLSTHLTLAIILRLIQGAGIACVVNSANALILEYFTVEERPKKIAFLISGTGLGFCLGPIIGGVLLHYFSWPALFFINVPFAVAALIVSFVTIPKGGHRSNDSIDVIGLILLTASVVFLSTLASQGAVWGWTSSNTLIIAAIFIVLFASFVMLQRKIKDPLIDGALLNLKNLKAGCTAGLLLYFLIIGWLLIFGLYFQDAYHLDAIQTGLAFLPFAASFLVTPAFSAYVMKKVAHKYVVIFGFIISAVTLPCMTFISPTTSFIYLILPFFFFALGFNLTNTSTIPIALQFTPKERHGLGSGIAMGTRWFGGALGGAIISAVFGANLTVSPTHALHVSLWVLAGVALFAAVFSCFAVKHAD